MTPVSSNGKYFLVNHGNQTEEISEKQFIKIRTQNFVSDSSRWLIFCGLTTFILYNFIKASKGKTAANIGIAASGAGR